MVVPSAVTKKVSAEEASDGPVGEAEAVLTKETARKAVKKATREKAATKKAVAKPTKSAATKTTEKKAAARTRDRGIPEATGVPRFVAP